MILVTYCVKIVAATNFDSFVGKCHNTFQQTLQLTASVINTVCLTHSHRSFQTDDNHEKDSGIDTNTTSAPEPTE